MLDALHHRGVGRAILTNGSPDMVGAAVHAAGIGHLLDDVLSVDSVKRFKPAADVYALVEARMGVAPDQVLFVSSNGWDAAGAARFGFRVAWVNRTVLPVDHLPARPTHQLSDLVGIPDLI
jgi:2-haloacid dehalogenase